ncbi:MAG: DNA primase, partial [Bryobacteraceae bacterium]
TQLEAYVEKRQVEAAPSLVLVSDADKAEALKLGRSADLVNEILRDMARLGLVGEETNRLIGYLVMTSRKMDDPLALLILSGSGAGKSHLQDIILSLCPDEELIKLTSLTGQALFYKGEDSLRHKALAVEEEAGASEAHYAIRNLISAKKLVIESTIKNALTGKLETQVNTVHGPTAVFQTTTNPQTDA